MATKIPGIPVPITLSLFRFKMPDGTFVMAADIPADQLAQDVPGSVAKLPNFKLDPALWYQDETIVMREGNIVVTTVFAPATGQIDKSPNIPRNIYSGRYDEFNVYLVPAPAAPPA